MIKYLIFDLGNVLLDQKTITADVYFALVLHISPSKSATFYSRYKRDAVCGTIPFIDLVRLYKKHFHIGLSEKEIMERYKQLYIDDVYKINSDLLILISKLKEKYSIYIMTNTLEPHFEHWKTLGFDTYFKRIFRSDTDHFIKPEKQSYEFVAKEIGVQTEECVFIDDLQENVQGAIQVGMGGVVYTDINSLISDLNMLGVDARS